MRRVDVGETVISIVFGNAWVRAVGIISIVFGNARVRVVGIISIVFGNARVRVVHHHSNEMSNRNGEDKANAFQHCAIKDLQ